MKSTAGARAWIVGGLVLVLIVSVVVGCAKKMPAIYPEPSPPPPASGSGLLEEIVVGGNQRYFARAETRFEFDWTADELWIVARDEPADPASAVEADLPGSGELRALDPEKGEVVPLPLQHTDVRAAITGSIGGVRVVQQYANPFDVRIEATYVFPLPQDAAVSDFVMAIGERRIRGIIREREEAERIYEQARRQGHTASLLTQERPNIFTERVANIEPGERIDVELTYYNQLPLRDGAYRFVFPMVVGPRYNPGSWSDGVGAVARGAKGASGQPVEVTYLRPGERSGHDLSLAVDIDAGVAIESIESLTHAVEIDRPTPGRAVVRLADRAVIPNRDFVLSYRVTGDRIKAALFEHVDDSGRYFTLELHPPADMPSRRRTPRELIFVLDCSGSMSGIPLTKAKRAVERVLRRLSPDDTFQIIRFSERASSLGPRPVPATAENIRIGLQHLSALSAGGGTEMLAGIKAALDFPHDPGRFRLVTFMTDGFIGNETEILEAIGKRLGPTRIFSFGVGSSPNRYLLERMAFLGRGAVAYVGLNDGASDAAVDAFYERIGHAALSEIEIDWGGMAPEEVYPSRVPDLFPDRPVLLAGRFRGAVPESLRVQGRIEGQLVELELPLGSTVVERHEAVPKLWARRKIADLALRAAMEPGTRSLAKQIKDTALDYGLMSAYTAFVAVDSTGSTPGEAVPVTVPVPVPDGVSPEATVSVGGRRPLR